MLDNKSLIRRLVFILPRPAGSSKYGTTRENTQRYYTAERLIRYMYCSVRLCSFTNNSNNFFLKLENLDKEVTLTGREFQIFGPW